MYYVAGYKQYKYLSNYSREYVISDANLHSNSRVVSLVWRAVYLMSSPAFLNMWIKH